MSGNFNPSIHPEDDVFNWRILAAANRLPNLEQPNVPVTSTDWYAYDLYNRNEKEAIRYGSRQYGINLRWGDPGASDNVRFAQRPGAAGPIKAEELIAIDVKGGGFLKYQGDRWGINLGWSATAVFEWQIVPPERGAAITTGSSVAIFNTVEKDFLFYDARTYGINLKWIKDKGEYNNGWLGMLTRAKVVEGITVKDVYEYLNK